MHFAEVYQQNYMPVFRLANKIVRDEDISKDISQEVFIKLLQALNSGTQIVNIPGWLYRVTVNYSYNQFRSRKMNGKAVANNHCSAEKETEIQLGECDQTQQLRNHMLRLKEKEQLILTLYSEGLSYKEIAEVSGIPFNSVGKSLTRALSKLKKLCHDK